MLEANFLHRCNSAVNLSTLQQRVCKYIEGNYQDLLFMTVEEVANKIDVSPATVVRSVVKLGYSSFQELKDEIRGLVISTQPPTRYGLESNWDEHGNESTLVRIARKNIAGIENMLTPHLESNFDKAVQLLTKASKIAITGQRSSKSAAIYFFLLLREFLPSVSLIGNMGTDEMYEELMDLSTKDIFFALSYGAPFYAKTTIEAIQFLQEKGIPVITLTDTLKNPAVPYSTLVLLVPCPQNHYSLVPVMTVLDSLVVEIGKHRLPTSKKRLRDLWKTINQREVIMSIPEFEKEMKLRLSQRWENV